MKDKIARIKRMLEQEQQIPQRDAAGVIIPQGIDSSVKVKVLQDVLKILEQ